MFESVYTHTYTPHTMLSSKKSFFCFATLGTGHLGKWEGY